MSRIRWRYDWVLGLALLCGLVAAGDFVAAALYQANKTVIYWYLMFDNYIDGAPGGGMLLGTLAGGLVLDWLALRGLARAGVSFGRICGIVALSTLLSWVVVGSSLDLLLEPLPGPLPLIVIVSICEGLCVLVAVPLWAVKQRTPHVRAALLSLLMGAWLLVLVIGVPLWALVSSTRSYFPLSSSQSGGSVYYQARRLDISDPPVLVLFQCDSAGIFCHEIGTEPDDTGP